MAFTLTEKIPKPELSRSVSEAKAPTRAELMLLRSLICMGLVSMGGFALWLFSIADAGHFLLFLLLCFSITYKFFRILHEWYHYWAIGTFAPPALAKVWSVDMFTTSVPGEPFEMIRQTLIAMQKVQYPHTSYLCDEGNDLALKRLCDELDVIYITREDKKDAKAGNINNALKSASGDICVIFDPDHQPLPEFLDHVLPYFNSPEVGFVQVVQAYSNHEESLIATGAAQQTYAFYGPMMMGMNSYGTVQALGANCTFRREALNSIGGHAAGLAEDMHTAMQLHAKGWKSIYVPKILTKGLVPATLSAYFKQQLKWSRGTFDLLFFVYPKLFKQFSWRQKLHYFMLPLHFAIGIFALIDVAIPVASLLTGQMPLHIKYGEFLLIITPFAGLTFLIRQYAQRWLVENHETGFHLTGGALLFATWWVYLLGLVYTIFNVKVPYIATPKSDKKTNNWTLSLPNLLICLISICAVVYGINRDWSPFSFIMASYAILNTVLLAYITFAGQHRLLHSIRYVVFRSMVLRTITFLLVSAKRIIAPTVYSLFRNKAQYFAIVILLCCSSAVLIKTNQINALAGEEIPEKSTGGFYTGIYQPSIQDDNSLRHVKQLESALGENFNIVSLYQFWGEESLKKFPTKLLTEIADRGSIAMITWEPYVSTFPERSDAPELRLDKKGMAAIAAGKFDDYIEAYALKIREYSYPVFIRFGHEADNPAYPWSATGENTPEEYVAAWRQVVSKFAALGVNNVAWVWTPWDPLTFDQYYPGDQFVDWVGLTCLNYGKASATSKWSTFEEIYEPFRKKALEKKKPVMLAEFGSTNYGGDGSQWISNSLKTIKEGFPEIKSLVVFNSNIDKNWVSDWRPSASTNYIDWSLQETESIRMAFQPFAVKSELWKLRNSPLVEVAGEKSTYSSPYLEGTPGNISLVVKDKPFYIKGVAYNAGHEWRDGNYPLTRLQLENDFKAIKEMGANTIRRYHPSFYDKNILNVAQEENLQVIYGFWFSPEVDYYKDTVQVREYLELVRQKVIQFKDSEAVLAWSIGNETSGLLKKHFEQPYLSLEREAYMHMLELMAQMIHQLDPGRSVITSLEHSWQLPGELHAFQQLVPSVDVIGINSYYTEQISQLQKLTQAFDPLRPYLVSEFGPKGYWNPDYTEVDKNDMLLEDSDFEKAKLYNQEWNNYINENRGYNIGGVAYCWRDRFEGTSTWFGMVDHKNRRKPVYYELKSIWGQSSSSFPSLTEISIIGPAFKLKPNIPFKYKVLLNSRNDIKSNVQIEWKLYKDDYLLEMKSLRPSDLNNEILVTLPDNGKRFRLYVYVSDDKGNVVTASKPIVAYRL